MWSILVVFVEVQEYVGHSSDIHLLLSFGSHIISVDECNTVKIFEIQTAGESRVVEMTYTSVKVVDCFRDLL